MVMLTPLVSVECWNIFPSTQCDKCSFPFQNVGRFTNAHVFRSISPNFPLLRPVLCYNFIRSEDKETELRTVLLWIKIEVLESILLPAIFINCIFIFSTWSQNYLRYFYIYTCLKRTEIKSTVRNCGSDPKISTYPWEFSS